MKFTVIRKDLLDALTFVKAAVPTRPTHPVLGTFHVSISDRVATITGFDLTSSTKTTLALESGTDGELCLPLKALDAIARIHDEVITISLESEQVRIQGANADIKLGTYSPEGYPALPDIPEDRIYISGKAFHEAVNAVAPFASDDENRKILTGVAFTAKDGFVELAATDGHRLAISRLDGELSAERLVIPAKALRLLPKKIDSDIGIGISEDNVLFDIDGKILISLRIYDNFPNYGALIPEKFSKHVLISHSNLIEALNVANLVQTDKSQIVHIDCKSDRIDLLCENEVGTARASTEAILEGDEISFGVNGRYLSEGIKGFEGDLTISLNNASSPVIITSSERPGALHLLMPIQIVG